MSRRKGTSMRSMIANLVNAQNEWKQGKIQFYPNGWAFTEVETDRSRRDTLGNLVALKPGRHASECPEPPGNFPIMVRGASVPAFRCRRCPHYIKPGFCEVLRALRRNEPDGIAVANRAIAEAFEKAQEMIR